MEKLPKDPIWDMMGLLFQAHPWHGVPIGEAAPEVVTTYIEIVPSDTVKYELDKLTGHLKVDRPQAFSNICPTVYGFVPRTYCADRVAELCNTATGRTDIVGDGDPLDICVLCEKVIPQGNILLQARPIGGLRMIDGDEADDKIVAVMVGDAAYGAWRDIGDCPRSLIDRLRHYFLTYKQRPGEDKAPTEITDIYDRDIAHQVIRRAQQDYQQRFGDIEGVLTAALRG